MIYFFKPKDSSKSETQSIHHENVDGMIKGKYKGLFNHYLSELMKLNYQIKEINELHLLWCSTTGMR